jgi:hypothetical protein
MLEDLPDDRRPPICRVGTGRLDPGDHLPRAPAARTLERIHFGDLRDEASKRSAERRADARFAADAETSLNSSMGAGSLPWVFRRLPRLTLLYHTHCFPGILAVSEAQVPKEEFGARKAKKLRPLR